jgi:protein-tyrosine phosphatase
MGVILYSTEPWARVADKIYIGGTYKLNFNSHESKVDVVYNRPVGFDLVVSMAQCGLDEGADGAMHLGYAIADGPIQEKDKPSLQDIAAVVHQFVYGRSHKVLIRCRAGCNRSALVAALVLIRSGWDRESAIEQIRAVRSCALSNEHFEKYILEGSL